MRVALAVLSGILLASLSLWSARTLSALPDVFSRPYHALYKGETVTAMPIKIEVDGHYEVALDVPRNAGELLDLPRDPPLAVQVVRGDRPVGTPSGGGWSGGEDEGMNVVSFQAHRGDIVLLSVRPSRNFAKLLPRHPRLQVARIPLGYAEFFLKRFALQLLTALAAAMSLAAFGIGWIARTRCPAQTPAA